MSANYKFVNSFYLYNDFSGKLIIKSWEGTCQKNVIIIGAAGRDFHNFNTVYRDNENYNVVAFTAAQIPDIDGRKYPPELAGSFILKEFRFMQKRISRN